MLEDSFNLVSDVCRELASNTDTTKALHNICKFTAEKLNLKLCFITVFDPREERLTVRGAYGMYLNELEGYRPEAALTGRAFTEHRVVNVPIMSQHISDNKLALLTSTRVNNFVTVPLLSGNRCIGTISLGRQAKQALPPKLISVLEAIAAPLAMYLINSNMVHNPVKSCFMSDHEKEREKRGMQRCCSEALEGRPIAPGVCAGRAVVLAGGDLIRSANIEKTDDATRERKALDKAYSMAKASLQKTQQEVNDLLSEADSSIFEMHEMLLEDPSLRQRICKHLAYGYTLQTAICQTYREFEMEYMKVDDEYLRERLKDIEDILLRLLNCAGEAIGKKVKATPAKSSIKGSRNLILIARELLPSQLVTSQLREVCGIVCETGGATSHAAILARALRIPMLVGVTDIMSKISSGDQLMLDCFEGTCYLHPHSTLLMQHKNQMLNTQKHRNARNSAAMAIPESEPPVNENPKTADGVSTHLGGNVTLFSELPLHHMAGVHTVGLYRTEFMFMIRNTMPSEEEQFKMLSKLVQKSGDSSVTIRALDIGGDKPLPYVQWGDELNPSLGWRGLRFLLSNPDFLMPHLRAMLRTTMYGNVRIMFPMVADRCDVAQVKKAIESAKASLKRDGIKFRNPEFGIMLEVPSILEDLDLVLPEIDFASIGTNDLIQYLFAVDRGNARVNKWYHQYHPIILKTLKRISNAFAKYPEKELSICGEMGGSVRAIPLLLGVGLRRFSMNSTVISPIRNYISKLKISECEELAHKAMNAKDDAEVITLITEFNTANGLKPLDH